MLLHRDTLVNETDKNTCPSKAYSLAGEITYSLAGENTVYSQY